MDSDNGSDSDERAKVAKAMYHKYCLCKNELVKTFQKIQISRDKLLNEVDIFKNTLSTQDEKEIDRAREELFTEFYRWSNYERDRETFENDIQFYKREYGFD